LGQAATAKPFRFFLVSLFTLDDRQIVHERRVYDVNGLLLQLAADSPVTADTRQRYRAALEKTKLEHEVKTAAAIQQALLPDADYRSDAFEVAGASVPCRAIGGDFFDYFHLQNGQFGFAVGDVAGKGPPAALLAARVQGILAAQSYGDILPAETMANVNRVLSRRVVESRFVTLMFGVLSSEGLLTYCNAGHNPPLLVRRSGIERLDKGGLVLGVFLGPGTPRSSKKRCGSNPETCWSFSAMA
jgi:sigma-B regulation protein RsbU (phosphoserine phosphatase)